MGAIAINPSTRRAEIARTECVECSLCFRGMSQEHLNPTFIRAVRSLFAKFRVRFDPEPDVCPTAAIEQEELSWPRSVRRDFSDVVVPHDSTGVAGRGTEEVKTNDVTGRVKRGEAGFVVEVGRPAVGVWFADINRLTMTLARAGACFEEKNPVTQLMEDRARGVIRSDILAERVLSAIVEFKASLDQVDRFIDVVEQIAPTLDTVVALGVAAVDDPDGSNPIEGIMQARGYPVIRGKMNLGLGRVTNPPEAATGDRPQGATA
jgi:hypothetical protein